MTNGGTNGSSTKLKPKKSKSPSLLTTNGQTTTATTQLSPTSTGSSHSTNRQFDIKPELLAGTGNVNSLQSSLQSSQTAAINHHMLTAGNQPHSQQNNLQSNLNAQLGQQAHNLNNLNHLNNHNQQMHHHLHQMTAGQQYPTHAQHQQMHHSHLNHHGLQSPVQNIANPSHYHQHAASLQNQHNALVAHHHMLGQHQLNAAIQQSSQSQLQSNYCISPSSRTDSDSPYNGANSTASNSAATNGAVQQANGAAAGNQSAPSNGSNGTQTPNSQQPTAPSTPSANQFTPAVLVKRESPNFSSSLHHSFTNSNSNGSNSSNSQALVSSNPSSNSSSNSSISLTAAAIATANAINSSAGNITPNDTQPSSLIPATSAHHHPITSLHPAVYNMAANANTAVFNHPTYVQSTADQLAFDPQLAYSQHARSLWPGLNQSVSDLVNNNNCIQSRMAWSLPESNYTAL